MIIEFSVLNVKLLLFLVYPIFIRIQDYTYASYIKDDKDNQLFSTFRYFFSYLLSGILYLIFRFSTKRKHNTLNENKSDNQPKIKDDLFFFNDDNGPHLSLVDEEHVKIKRKKLFKIILFLFLLCAISIFSMCAGYFFKKKEYSNAKYSIRTFFEITNFVFISYFLLHQKLYRHHFISFGCITVMLIVIFVLSFSHLKEIGASILFYFLYEMFFGLYDVLIKKYFNIFYKSPYNSMLWLGLLASGLLLLYDIIAYFTNPSVSGIIIGFRDNINNAGDFFLFLVDLLVEFIWNLGIWLVIYYFTPCHYFIPEYISEYFYYMLKVTDEDNKNNDFYSSVNCILFSICFILNIIFILIFNEVIILNFCKLDYNTNKRIKEREKGEFRNASKELGIMENDSNDSFDRDSSSY